MNHILIPEVLHALYPYQIETIKRQVRDYITVKQSFKEVIFDVCPKCPASYH